MQNLNLFINFYFSANFQEIYSGKAKIKNAGKCNRQIFAYEAINLYLCQIFHGGLIYFFRFHTYDYARHFVSACTRILGLEGTPEGVEDQGRLTRVAAVIIKTMFL